MTELQRIDIKIFARDGADIDPTEFMPVLQRWIREQSIEGTLIDVADYSHMHHGPGIILVGHESNVSIDYTGGRMGLLYRRRQPLEGTFQERCESVLKSALAACDQLEQEEEFSGRLAFDRSDILFIANDRLSAPNEDDSNGRLSEEVTLAFTKVLGGEVRCTVNRDDSRNRATIAVSAS